MVRMPVRPQLLPTADALRSALARNNVKVTDLAKLLNVSSGLIYQWTGAKAAVNSEHAARLGTFLGVDPATLASSLPRSPGNRKAKKKAGRPRGAKDKTPRRTPNGTVGPAQRAVALHEARTHIQMLQPLQATQTPSRPRHEGGGGDRVGHQGVFGMEVRNGAMLIWLRTSVSLERGPGLLRALLDLGLVQEAGNDGQGEMRGYRGPAD